MGSGTGDASRRAGAAQSAHGMWLRVPGRASASPRAAGCVSVATKAEGPRIEKVEGVGANSEERVCLLGLAQDVADDAPVGAEAISKTLGLSQDGAGMPSDGRVLGRRWSVEQGMLHAEGSFERDECGVDEIDDDKLGCEEQVVELVRSHRFRALAAAFGLGVWRSPRRRCRARRAGRSCRRRAS
jgi:hypothetical protein